jgi:aryl-alcohol dehydrogenase-like predicted oxidoreductase
MTGVRIGDLSSMCRLPDVHFRSTERTHQGVSEDLVGEALAPVRDQVVIATKFGFKFESRFPFRSFPEQEDSSP